VTPHDKDEVVSFIQGVVIHLKRIVGIVELFCIYKKEDDNLYPNRS
jgi:hypothetical protein